MDLTCNKFYSFPGLRPTLASACQAQVGMDVGSPFHQPGFLCLPPAKQTNQTKQTNKQSLKNYRVRHILQQTKRVPATQVRKLWKLKAVLQPEKGDNRWPI